MNILQDPETHYERAVEAATQFYERQGYAVTTAPKPDDLPEQLRGFRPKLIAIRNGEFVVVEVKDSRKVRRVDDWRRFKEAVEKSPNWRLDLFLPGEGEAQVEHTSVSEGVIAGLLVSAEKLNKQNERNLALITAWMALEAILRSVATTRNLAVAALDPPSLLAALYEEGEFEPQQYLKLIESLALRNRVAHGQSVDPVSDEFSLVAIEAAKELLTVAEPPTD